MKKFIIQSIKYHKSKNPKHEAIAELHKYITHSVEHVYGDHRMCHSYNCGQEGIQRGIREIQNIFISGEFDCCDCGESQGV